RARHVRKHVREMLNSHGEWETCPPLVETKLSEIFVSRDVLRIACSVKQPADVGPSLDATRNTQYAVSEAELVPALSVTAALDKIGTGTLVVLSEDEHGKIY